MCIVREEAPVEIMVANLNYPRLTRVIGVGNDGVFSTALSRRGPHSGGFFELGVLFFFRVCLFSKIVFARFDSVVLVFFLDEFVYVNSIEWCVLLFERLSGFPHPFRSRFYFYMYNVYIFLSQYFECIIL